MPIPFVGGSYALTLRKADVQRSVNWFPSTVESGSGKSPAILQEVPGLALFAMPGVAFLLTEDGGHLLLESGERILLES